MGYQQEQVNSFSLDNGKWGWAFAIIYANLLQAMQIYFKIATFQSSQASNMQVQYISNDGQIKYQTEVNRITACRLIANLNEHKGSLLLQVSDELAVDFHTEEENSLWMEIIQPEGLSAAIIDHAVAEQVIAAAARNFDGMSPYNYLMNLEIQWDYR